MATRDLTFIIRQVPGEEQLMWRKAIGNGVPACVIPAAELLLFCYLNLHLQSLPGQPLILIAITFNYINLGEGTWS